MFLKKNILKDKKYKNKLKDIDQDNKANWENKSHKPYFLLDWKVIYHILFFIIAHGI